MNKISKFLTLALTVVLGCTLASCGDDDEPEKSSGNESTKGEWYISPRGFATSEDFREIIDAIDNNELLSDYGKFGKHYAELDEFFADNGMYDDGNAEKGRLRWALNYKEHLNIIHFVDDMTVEFYGAYLYKDSGKKNAEGEQRIWSFYAGRYFENMAYYINNPTNLIYTKKGNTYVFSDGNIYIKKSNNELQGDWGMWKKFTPTF